MSTELNDYKQAVSDAMNKFKRSRVKRFITKHNCNETDIHIHNEVPIWHLVKSFKSTNNLKTRTFKNLSPELKEAWVHYYDSNKKLLLLTNEEHQTFHNEHTFDVKNNVWILNSPSEPVHKKNESPPKSTPNISTEPTSKQVHKKKKKSPSKLDSNSTTEESISTPNSKPTSDTPTEPSTIPEPIPVQHRHRKRKSTK